MLYNNKQVSGWNKSLDINGNAIAKIFMRITQAKF